MKVSDLALIKHNYVPSIDGYMSVGMRKCDKSLKRFVVAWSTRHKPDNIVRRKSFMDIDSALKYYDDLITTEHSPSHKQLEKDWQQYKLYDWEHKFVEPYGRKINKAEAQTIIAMVSHDYGIDPPELVWANCTKKQSHSEYDSNDNVITFRHRDSISLLHELAHAIHESVHEDGPNHGPQFAWLAIELYHRYENINLPYLVTTAQTQGLLGHYEDSARLGSEGHLKQYKPPNPKPRQ